MDIDVLGSYNTLKAVLPHLVASAERNPCDGVSGMFIPRYVIFNPKESDTTVGVDTPPKKASTSTGGRILFVSATLHYAGTPLQTHVSAAKAAVDALSASVAIEQGPKGVRSNVVAPGAFSPLSLFRSLFRQRHLASTVPFASHPRCRIPRLANAKQAP